MWHSTGKRTWARVASCQGRFAATGPFCPGRFAATGGAAAAGASRLHLHSVSRGALRPLRLLLTRRYACSQPCAPAGGGSAGRGGPETSHDGLGYSRGNVARRIENSVKKWREHPTERFGVMGRTPCCGLLALVWSAVDGEPIIWWFSGQMHCVQWASLTRGQGAAKYVANQQLPRAHVAASA